MGEPRPAAPLSEHAFDFAVAPMIVIARDGKISLWNQSAEKLFKKSNGITLRGNTCVSELFQERSNSLLTDIVVSANGAPLAVNLGCSKTDAKPEKRSLNVKALTNKGMETCYLLTIGTDLPILKSFRKLNMQLKESNARSAEQRQRMIDIEKRNRELEQFSIATAHDLKGPLIQVQMLLDVFTEDYGDTLEDEASGLINKASSSVQNLRQMIDKLLSQARQEPDQYKTHTTNLDQSVDSVISSMVEILNSIDAEVNVPPHMGTVNGSDVKFQQVLSNIISNSIKYRMTDRRLCITLEIDTWEDTPTRLRIRDNGIGFDTADSKRLFEPFSRLEDNNATGHGIGLSTCRRVCEQQGWMLAASGTPGEGSEFQIIFNTQLPPDLAATLSMCAE